MLGLQSVTPSRTMSGSARAERKADPAAGASLHGQRPSRVLVIGDSYPVVCGSSSTRRLTTRSSSSSRTPTRWPRPCARRLRSSRHRNRRAPSSTIPRSRTGCVGLVPAEAGRQRGKRRRQRSRRPRDLRSRGSRPLAETTSTKTRWKPCARPWRWPPGVRSRSTADISDRLPSECGLIWFDLFQCSASGEMTSNGPSARWPSGPERVGESASTRTGPGR